MSKFYDPPKVYIHTFYSVCVCVCVCWCKGKLMVQDDGGTGRERVDVVYDRTGQE